MISKRLKFVVLSILVVAVMSLPLIGQTETKIDCGVVAKLNKPKSSRIVSLGVINGKAIDLVTPEYPSAARAVSAHGSVEVSILIDTRGCVSEAKALSGHPLLIPASVRAATKSTFSPTTLSSGPIWVYGVIVYDYIPASLNWFELGIVSNSSEKLIDFLPTGFDLQRNELINTKRLSYDEMQKANAKVLDSIHVELAAKPKEQWLFDAGRKLSEISKYDWSGLDGLQERIREIQQLLETAPDNVSKDLVSRLNELVSETDSNAFWKRLKDIKARSYNFGN